ncbi:hypothetical protein CHS0354_001737 [Potamilus streckersoni]|uniref:E3 ubiquitin-protein ligase n=1 Tax=Potamilus streckersoni TaxID=2493646 RepID=A0AAE0T1V9_9BIVA|nr:hypothetical protein CHS0354_001737 [Potamilus streckersoni]
MAESPATINDHKYIEELKETFLICCVCHEEFDEASHHPRLLPCLHSVCFTCLQKLINEEKVKCPICNDNSEVPGNDPNVIRKDNTRRDLLDFVSVRTEAGGIKCTQCEKDTAVSRCSECKDFLCRDCTHAHQVTKMTKYHPVSSFEKLLNMSLTEFSGKLKCQKSGHDQYTLDLYCTKDGCRHPICTLCALTEHKEANGHEVKDVTETYTKEVTDTKEILTRAVETAKDVEKVMSEVKDEIHNVEVCAMNLEDSIKAAFNNCRKMLDRREQELIQQVKQHCQGKVKTLVQQKACLDEFKTELNDSISFTNGVLSGYSPTAFLQVHGRINERHEHLYARRFDQCPHATANMIFNVVNMGAEFQKHVFTLGNVESFDIYPAHCKIEASDGLVGQASKVIKVFLYDRERRPFPEEKADVQVRILDTSSQPMTPFYAALYSKHDNAFVQEVTGDEPGDFMAEVYVCGVGIGEKLMFKIKDNKSGASEDKGARAREPPQKKKSTKVEHTATESTSRMNGKAVTRKQPQGTMDIRLEATPSLPGYDGCATIVITYTFQGGIQGEDDPNPMKPYTGTKRTAYLPDNKKGQKITKLLKVAFDRGLLFMIGVSQTTGVENCIVWNGVLHKTNRHGGPQMFGYPDPDYLDQVLGQLAAKGVTEADLPK